MTSPRLRVLVAVVGLATATSLLSAPAHAATSRQRQCVEAWAVIATESPALGQGNLDAWRRVTDAFLSFSDASFDGRLSNAFGDVASAADAAAASIGSGTTVAAPTSQFLTALSALGAVCSRRAPKPPR